ncbi:MAG: winged helix-turn-helix domain-containing protein [Planctomycetes bacterium]|nr:winged helix-turn-helix domain-containing protein [Planctomycetota bacterium]
MHQRTLDFARARATDPSTSHVAGRRASEFAADHHRRILETLRRIGPATIHEIAAASNLDHVAVARRMPELEREGLASASGGERKGPSGRPCRIWGAVA